MAKYRNVKTTVHGITFDSKKEAARYVELYQLLKAGKITDLSCQVTFKIAVNGVHICRYIADFVYLTKKGDTVVEDVKGVKTAVYQLKKKMMLAVHNIKIKEI